MRNVANILGVTVILYLAGAFTAATFDIREWAPLGRYILTIVWLGVCILVSANAYVEGGK
jgi:hypothetical protein